MNKNNLDILLKGINFCVIIPTFNNASTLRKVLDEVSIYTSNIIIVNDGSTDETEDILSKFPNLELISYPQNRGKGYALKQGFKRANALGFDYAITFDSDGQHVASDMIKFIEQINLYPEAMFIGSRFLQQTNMPKKSSFANKFSNFWFKVHTFVRLPDTQSGFRLYPLQYLKDISIITNRFEMELEILVRLAWKFIPIISIPISVIYLPKNERVTHFKPFKDFTRISILNTIFTFIAIFYFYPKFFIRKIKKNIYI